MDLQGNEFSIPDYVVFVLVLVISLGIGLFYASKRSKQRTREDFLMAGRNVKLFPVLFSLFASFHSAIVLMGLPAEHYTRGLTHLAIALGHSICLPIAAHMFLPVYFPLRLTSVYEYLEKRFKSRAIRRLGTVAMIIDMIFYMSIVLYAPSMAFSSVTKINLWVLLLTVGLICTIYTTLGGMKAVLWTDVFQVVIMFTGILAVIIQGCINVGGIDKVWQLNYERKRFDLVLDPNPFMYHNVWAILFGGAIKWLATYGTHQTQVQRYACLSSLREAQKALYLTMVLIILMTVLTTIAGIVVFANYAGCDPLMNGIITKKDQLMPYFVMDSFGKMPGLPGLFLAALFSGSMSTISSGLNSLAAVTWEDFLKFLLPKVSEIKSVYITKGLVLLYGILTIGLAFLTAHVSGLVQAYNSFSGAFGGPMLGLFLLALFVPWVNVKGTFCGIITAYILSSWITIGQWIYGPYNKLLPTTIENCDIQNGTNYSISSIIMFHNETQDSPWNIPTTDYFYPTFDSGLTYFYSLSFWWFATFGILVTFIVAIPVSFITGPRKLEDVDLKLLSFYTRYIYWCIDKNKWERIEKKQAKDALDLEDANLNFLDSPQIKRQVADTSY